MARIFEFLIQIFFLCPWSCHYAKQTLSKNDLVIFKPINCFSGIAFSGLSAALVHVQFHDLKIFRMDENDCVSLTTSLLTEHGLGD